MTPPEARREEPADRGPVPCYELADWAGEFGIVAGLTARGPDLGLASELPVREGLECWQVFRQQMNRGFKTVVVAHQCHGTAIAEHPAGAAGWRVLDETDGHVTDQAGILLGVTIADCVPVYLAHPASPWVGLLHAGWRGVAGEILERGIERVAHLAACAADELIVHLGVSICGECYEVGPEVYQAVVGERPGGPRGLDLRAELARRAERSGVRRISLSPWCTAHDTARFYSHRRSGGRDGRMVAYVGRPLA